MHILCENKKNGMNFSLYFYLIVLGVFVLNETVFENIRLKELESMKVDVCREFDEYLWGADELKEDKRFLKVLKISDSSALLVMGADKKLSLLNDIHIRERDRDKVVKECISTIDYLVRVRSYF